ncbi:hypothetical protein [Streptomyces sp. CNQ085]|uniref:hypothetical protein n=1 Tax=Streptomyces sp. CNQ085 TaxID=2886944 RepID=UPI001F50740C|nr:hypothetical protein [Streptomyces sp. CNQ085]MCI0384586.1 hypothetical protein [Streptomyces sp. CNQ085]
MADLDPQRIPLSGLQPVYSAASAGGDTAPIGTDLLLLVRNDGASPVTITVAAGSDMDGLTIGDASEDVPAGGDVVIPMGSVYRDTGTGRAAITYSDTTSVDVAVLQLR